MKEKIKFITKQLIDFAGDRYNDYEEPVRVISNSIHDFESPVRRNIGKMYHSCGPLEFKKGVREIMDTQNDQLDNYERYVSEGKKRLRYLESQKAARFYRKEPAKREEEIAKTKEFLSGMTDLVKKEKDSLASLKENYGTQKLRYLKEHIFGRDAVAKILLSEVKGMIRAGESEESIDKRVEELLDKYAITIHIEKYKNVHTKLNKALEKIQKGNTTFESYKQICEGFGYTWPEEATKDKFPETSEISL